MPGGEDAPSCSYWVLSLGMDVSASVSGEARGGTLGAGGCSSLGEELFSAEAAMLGLVSSGVCSFLTSGAVVFWRRRRDTH